MMQSLLGVMNLQSREAVSEAFSGLVDESIFMLISFGSQICMLNFKPIMCWNAEFLRYANTANICA